MKQFSISGYKVYWSILTTKTGRAKFYWSTNKGKALKQALDRAKKGQRIYIITDRQFGMITNHYKPKSDKPKGRMVLQSDSFWLNIPITSKQLESVYIK
jgi:hypothetical protein